MLRTYPISTRQATDLATKVYAAHKAQVLPTQEAYEILTRLGPYRSDVQWRKYEKWIIAHSEELGFA